MRSLGAWGVGAWVLAVSGGLALVSAAFAPVGGSVGPSSVLLRPSPSFSVPSYPADSLAAAAVARDVFRVSRRPAAAAYDLTAVATVPAALVPRPTLSLVGLVNGRDATAVIEGFPGTEGGRVVRVGDKVGELRIVNILADRVRIVGMDTVWVLKVREPWR